MPVIEKATLSQLAVVDQITTAQLDQVAERARDARKGWAADPQLRRSVLLRACEILEANRGEVVEWIVRESGSIPAKGNGEVTDSIAELANAADLATEEHGVILRKGGTELTSVAERVPYGTVGIITPWNVPLLLAMRSVAPALGLGNTVILKPDNQTAISGGILIARVLEEAGVPSGVFNVVPGAGTVIGEALILHPLVGLVSFTGSTMTGRRIASLAAPLLKKVALELGGKNPHVVLADADVDGAAASGAWGTFQHQGQVCMAIGRHIVDSEVVDRYTSNLVARAAILRQGDPFVDEVELGPLINERQAAHVEEIVEDARARGAVVVGGERHGAFMPPTVISGVVPGMRAYGEEIFGPVAVVIAAKSDEDAIRIANDTEYGLSASVHSADLLRANSVADRIRSGMVHINAQPINDNPWSPMGGLGASGSGGRFGGPANVEMFTTWRWRTTRTVPERGFFPEPKSQSGHVSLD
ncbi:aldehyde dehydrogenase family protein [Subtercola endophyticus]|nr:aldehyde dehydrogenase family protein [Subtercola endophyticus]